MSDSLLCRIGEIVREAGRGVLRTYREGFRVEFKGPNDPVTRADRDANDLICSRIQEQWPDAAVVAEESPPEDFADFRRHERVFFVDPLDGTREFVAGNGQFVVMVGVLEGEAATLGAIYAPTSDTLWLGERSVGAFLQRGNGTLRPISIGRHEPLLDARIVVSRSHRSARLSSALAGSGVASVIPLGSAGLKGAEVAQGGADAYLALGPCGKLWDACAVDALVSAAGGRVTDAEGHALDYRGKDLGLRRGIVAANPALHGELCRHLDLVEGRSGGPPR